jgi:type I restriction enzyme, S subunit
VSLNLKPYPEYKDSGVPWLGQVPAYWPVPPAFAAFRERQEPNKGLKEKQVLSLSYGRIVKKRADALHGLVPASFETFQVVEPGNVILRLTDLQNDQRSLRVGLAKDRGIITSAYVCLSVRGHLLPEFAYYLLHAADVQKVFYGMGAGLRQSIGFADLRRLPLVIPDENEQRQIVALLNVFGNRTEKLIHAKRRIIELLNAQKQAIIHRAVTRGLDDSVRLKASRVDWLGDIADGWEIVRVKRVAKIVRGKFSHRPRNDPQFYDGPYPFIQTGDVARAAKTIKTYSQTLNEKGLSVSKRFPSGTMVMTIAANIGDVAVLDFEACFPDSVIGFIPSSSMDRDFLYYAFCAMKPALVREAPVNTQGNLNVDRVGSMFVVKPPYQTQLELVRNIEERTSAFDTAITTARKEIELLREYNTRLIADVVTGKIDVRGLELPDLDAAEEPDPRADEEEELESEELVGAEEGEDAAD